MAEFLIKMADDRGRMVEQTESGGSATDIRDRFAAQGFLVYSVKAQGMMASGALPFGRKKVKLEDFVIFNQQFITLFKAGLPILTALELLSKRQKSEYFRGLLENVRDRVRGGQLLSDSFAAQNAFPKLYTTTLMAGEKSGNLEEVLGRFISYQRLVMTFRKKLMVSLTYPALLIVMVTLMVTFLITYVVPQFAKLFEDMHATLPAITQVMLAIGVGSRKYSLIVLAVLAIAVFLEERWRRSENGSEQMDRLIGLLADAVARDASAGGGFDLAKVSGGPVFANDVHAAARGTATGVCHGHGGAIHWQPADEEVGGRC